MKRISLFFTALCLLISIGSKAQNQNNTIAIPNSSFENWSNGNGYSVTALFIPLPVYSSYTYPTGWDYPTYPVNQTITYNSINVNVNTNLPLIKMSNMTSGAVNGNHALKMESFMLSDIIGTIVYNLASPSLDPMMTNSVFPTILSTGVVNVMQFLPMMYDITSNFGNLSQLMTFLTDVDMNNLIDGGIPLNGVVPGKMTGYYKYTSAGSGDNGGILMLGTRYNPVTHRREVVGAGYTVALTDHTQYIPFELNYMPLCEIHPYTHYTEADSLVIFLFSSANTNPQQGSALYLDNLQLFVRNEPIHEDTCSAVFNLAVDTVDTTHATISWTYEGNPDHFELEYGPHGFTPGNGTSFDNPNNNSFTINDLLPDNYYDIYVRSVCINNFFGEWTMVTFHTDTLVPPVIIHSDTTGETTGDTTGIQRLAPNLLSVYPNPAHGQCVVQFAQEMPKTVRLYTIAGALIQEFIPTKETMELILPSKGIFILSCEMKEGTVVRKIVNQ
ncbi:MAG: fibronectin type III domain-containing protein [Bacteroidales bacterium]|nr:fibronectin type III domain-containing protein [Bacteroidales bacterium]